MVSTTIGIAAIVGASSMSLGGHTVVNSSYANIHATNNIIKTKTITEEPKPKAKVELAAVTENQSDEKPAEAKPQPEPPTVVTVQPGEYLEKIAKANNTTSLRIFYANTDIQNPDLIYPNQQLRIPKPEEALTPREVPVNKQIAVPTPDESAQAVAPRKTPAPAVSAAPSVAGGGVWDSLAACEAGGNWAINTGNGYYGGLQFSLSSWRSVGGTGLPSQASREEQIMRGQMLQSRSGWGAWPSCSAKLGLR